MEPAVYLNTWRFIPNNKIKNTHPNTVESEFIDENEKFFLLPVLAQVDPVLQNLSQGSEPWVSKRFNTATHKKKEKKSRIQLASERGQREEGINTWTALYWVLLKKKISISFTAASKSWDLYKFPAVPVMLSREQDEQGMGAALEKSAQKFGKLQGSFNPAHQVA